MLDLLLQILKKYRDTAPDGKLLPIYCNSVLNLYLKEIARIYNIDRPLIFYLAHHTFATLSLAAGGDLYTVGKLLGHTNIHSTQVYADVVMETKVEAVNRLSSFFREQ